MKHNCCQTILDLIGRKLALFCGKLESADRFAFLLTVNFYYIIQRIALKVNKKKLILYFSEIYMEKFEKRLDFLVILCYND